MKKFVEEFKSFIMRGNVVDMAVGVVIGTAFSGIVNGLVQDIIMPIVSLLTGKIDFTNLFVALDGNEYATLDAAREATSVIAYGNFIQTVVQFIIIAFSIFLTIKVMSKMQDLTKKKVEEEAAEPTTKVCPFCKSEINIEAVKCMHCASDVE